MDIRQRRSRVSALLDAHGLSAALYLSPENVRYLSGFIGSNGQLFLSDGRAWLLTDGRYAAQAEAQADVDDIIVYEQLSDVLGELVRVPGRTGFEAGAVTVAQWRDLQRKSPVLAEVAALPEACVEIRMAKDAEELQAIERAIAIAEKAFVDIEAEIRPGRREREVSLALEWAIRTSGSRTVPFEFIVASGERSAMPHGVASGRTLRAGDLLTIDFGAEHDGYISDMTVAGTVGHPDAWLKEIVDVLVEAQQAAFAALRAGVRCPDVDAAARTVIERAGYGEAFSHSLGHGVGLAIHEAPRLSRLSEEILQAGTVVTIEPGIYVPGRGGARIEDMVVVTDDGYRKLTTLPKSAYCWSQGAT